MRGLVRLYPRAWRERYGAEFAELISNLARERSRAGRLWLAVDVVRGALDAQWQRRPNMRIDPAVRRGFVDGLVIAVVLATLLVLGNVVFPAGPNESDDDPEYLVQLAAAYLIVTALLIAIGARGRRRSDRPWAGAKAGGVAGLVMILVVLVTIIVVDNAFFSIVSQQHDKRMAFAASGWSSMRAFVNFQILTGALVMTPVATVVGGLLGSLGGAVFRPRSA